MVESILLINSGRNLDFIERFSRWSSSSSSILLSRKPILLDLFLASSTPIFEVKIIKQFLKSTTSLFPNLISPLSKIERSKWNRESVAFSTSSNNIIFGV